MFYELAGPKKVHIPFTVEADGRISAKFGEHSLRLVKGAKGTLVVPCSAVEDEPIRELLQKEVDAMLWPKGSRLLAEVSTRSFHLASVQPLADQLVTIKGGR